MLGQSPRDGTRLVMRRSLALGWLLFATAFVFSVVPAPAVQAATIHPNETIDVTYISTGCNRDAPDTDHCTLRDAITAALPGDTVSLESPAPAGPYMVTQSELLIQKNITIRGAGARLTTITAAGCPAPCRVINIDQAKVTISGVTITGGKATGPCGGMGPCPYGGGILARGSTMPGVNNAALTLVDSTVRDNTATATGTYSSGAGISIQAGTLTVINSTITGNRSTNGMGGGINGSIATGTITNSTIAGNIAGDNTNAGDGGGISSNDSTWTLRSTTISGNTATGSAATPRGGNLRAFPGTTFDVRDSIVANGIANAGRNCYVVGNSTTPSSIISTGHNIDSLDECNFHAAGDRPNTDPGLGPLANNGGPTDTQALTAGSPAVDAGSPGCPPPSTDQRGVLRPQGIACDIGAFELAQVPPGPPGGPPAGGLPGTAALSAVTIKPSVFPAAANGGSIARRRARRTGTTISYRDSQAGTTTFTILTPAKGMRDKRRRCVAPKKGSRGARCTRYLSAGTFTHADKAGANSFHFTGRVRRRKLAPGSYRLQAVPRANGKNGKAVTVSFRIVK